MTPRLDSIVLSLCLALAPGCKSPHSDTTMSTASSGSTPAQQANGAAAATPLPPVWPRQFVKGGDTILMYQPQVDSWKDHSSIEFRSALAVTPQAGGQTHYGVVTVKGDTLVDENARTVLVTNMVTSFSWPGLSGAQAQALTQLGQSLMPASGFVDISLDQVLAYVRDTSNIPKVELNYAPPPIYYSEVPAILVIYMGPPQFQPVTGTKLMFAVNTNWVVLMDPVANQYFLLDGDSWLTAPDPVQGPWTAATMLPPAFSQLPSDKSWSETKKHIPGSPFKVVPKVFSTTTPSELIVTDGTPDYSPIPGTRLMYVSNPTTPLFLDLIDSNYYYVVTGRWFRAPALTGPWSAASADLPAEFAKIPPSSPVGFVLSSVPGTQEAQDAILLAAVPHKATINIATATVNVTYNGTPKFVPIAGTSMTYAVDTPYEVIFADGQYYCCYQGVWFLSPAATGPWTVCTKVPQVIYTIPPTCPVYNVTYVYVYSSTPTTVVVGSTGGYSGEYVAATGALMFGAGMLVGAAIADNNCHYYYPPCYCSYGCAAHYSYGYGCYTSCGAKYYGPCGSAGWGASYNPSTGTYARGGYESDAYGSKWGAQAYNPYTNTYAQHTGGTNGYSSWGSSYVSQGNKWAEGSHESNAYGSAGWAENSSGQEAAGVHSNKTDSSIAATNSGNVYASHDGNVYKNTGSGWQSYQGNGNWSSTSSSANKPSTSSSSSWSQHDTQTSLNQDSWSRSQGSGNTASSYNDRSSGWGGGSSGGSSWGGGDSSRSASSGGGGGGGGRFGGGGGGWDRGGGGGGWGGRGRR